MIHPHHASYIYQILLKLTFLLNEGLFDLNNSTKQCVKTHASVAETISPCLMHKVILSPTTSSTSYYIII